MNRSGVKQVNEFMKQFYLANGKSTIEHKSGDDFIITHPDGSTEIKTRQRIKPDLIIFDDVLEVERVSDSKEDTSEDN